MICSTCNLTFKSKANYTKHLKSQRHLSRLSNECVVYKCICGKGYSHRVSLCVHRKTCQKHQESKLVNNVVMSEMKQRLDKYENEREELKSQISLLLENQNNKPMKTRRRKITPFLRSKIKESQNHACNICSLPLSEYFQIDHMIALQYGGTDDEQNLQALCCECHAKKSIIENKKRESIKKAIDLIINQEISESPDPRIQNSM
jgi:5-methylcytosine-specific restriction endonuclease McrA